MEPVSVDGTDVLNLPGQTLTNPQSINAYLDALRFTCELKRTHRVLWEDGENHVFYLAGFSLPEAWRPCMGEAYSLLSLNPSTGLAEVFVYFSSPVALSSSLPKDVLCLPLPISPHCPQLYHAARALARVVRASEEPNARYKTFGECPAQLREAAQRMLDTVDLTLDAEPVAAPAVAVAADPVAPAPNSVKPDPDAPHCQVLPLSLVHDVLSTASMDPRIRVAMRIIKDVVQEGHDAHARLQEKYQSLTEEVLGLKTQNADQVAMLAENASWISEQAAALAHHVAHIQALTEELAAKRRGRG